MNADGKSAGLSLGIGLLVCCVVAIVGRTEAAEPPSELKWATTCVSDLNKHGSEKVISSQTEALKLTPQDFRPYACRAFALHHSSKPSPQAAKNRAIRDLTQALTLAPQEPPSLQVFILSLRANIYSDLGKHQQAIQDLNKVIEIIPQSGLTYYNRGLSYHELGEHQLAVQDLRTAAKLGHKLSKQALKYQDAIKSQPADEDIEQKMKDIKTLCDKGLLTSEECKEAKMRILGLSSEF